MTLLSWAILLAVSAVLVMAEQYLFFRHDCKKTDFGIAVVVFGRMWRKQQAEVPTFSELTEPRWP
jgi:hypothetical protein